MKHRNLAVAALYFLLFPALAARFWTPDTSKVVSVEGVEENVNMICEVKLKPGEFMFMKDERRYIAVLTFKEDGDIDFSNAGFEGRVRLENERISANELNASIIYQLPALNRTVYQQQLYCFINNKRIEYLHVFHTPPHNISLSTGTPHDDYFTRRNEFDASEYPGSSQVYDLHLNSALKDAADLSAVGTGLPINTIVWFQVIEGNKRRVEEGRQFSLVRDLSINNSVFVVAASNERGIYSVAINVHLTCSPNFTVYALRAQITKARGKTLQGSQAWYDVTIINNPENVTLMAGRGCGDFIWYKLLNGELHTVSESKRMILETSQEVVQDAFFLATLQHHIHGYYNVTIATMKEYAPTLIDVKEFEIYPEEDGKVETRCTADARPAAHISYYKIDEVSGDKREIPSQNGWMRINAVRLARDAGQYVCEARNVHGSISAEFLISGLPNDVSVVFEKINKDSVLLELSTYSNFPVEFKVDIKDKTMDVCLNTHTVAVDTNKQLKQIPNIVLLETITGLRANTPYDLDLTATNKFGDAEVTMADFATD